MPNSNLRIGFIHPDLGIGGAEQLVVNMAVGLQNAGHDVTVYTPFHDPGHCFKETRDGTLDVVVCGKIFPRAIFGKFIALCASIRMLLASIYVIFFCGHFDVIIVDQVSFCVPLLRLCGRRVLFYCHFPDKLLCVNRTSFLKKLYRFVLDIVEEICLIPSNMIVTNSKFTQETFYRSFKILKIMGKSTQVLYPAIDLSSLDINNKSEMDIPKPFFLSLNRYERKKGIGIALKALKELNSQNATLIVAGGHDPRMTENVEHCQELQTLAKDLGISDKVRFLKNVTNEERIFLLANSAGVLYTPENEHFGIVPTEAMYLQTPILAMNSGGPKESVLNGKTGFLLPNDEKEWAAKMNFLLENEKICKEMGKSGKERVDQLFGLKTFGKKCDELVKEIIGGNKKKSN